MKDLTISENIIAVLDDVSKKLGIAIDWTSESVMPYLKDTADRIVQFELTTSIIWTILTAGLILVMALIGRHIYKMFKGKNENSIFVDVVGWNNSSTQLNPGAILMITVMAVFTTICIGIILAQINDIVQCCVLPERVVIDYISYYL